MTLTLYTREVRGECDSRLLLILQDFRVLTLLGKGSFACVYRAKSVNTGLEVAIKMVRLSLYIFLSEWFCWSRWAVTCGI